MFNDKKFNQEISINVTSLRNIM